MAWKGKKACVESRMRWEGMVGGGGKRNESGKACQGPEQTAGLQKRKPFVKEAAKKKKPQAVMGGDWTPQVAEEEAQPPHKEKVGSRADRENSDCKQRDWK